MLKTNKFPSIMGIMNVTPDSFSDGGDISSIENALELASKWNKLGVDIIDIGGESTRPGASKVDEDEEIRRTEPYITAIANDFPNIKISIDTTKYNVAKRASRAGASIINDISGLTQEPRLAELAAEENAELVIMHIQGTPQNMQIAPKYTNIIDEIYAFLDEKINFASKIGVQKIIADIGIGFGKTYDDNWKLLQNLERFKSLEVPLLIGLSRKRFIGELLGINEPKERDIATILLHSLLMNQSIDIIRLHNIEFAVQLKSIYQRLNSNG